MQTETTTETTTSLWRSRNSFAWEMCYPADIEVSLLSGYRVKRVTVERTRTVEYLELGDAE